jgi:hypothetical protein
MSNPGKGIYSLFCSSKGIYPPFYSCKGIYPLFYSSKGIYPLFYSSKGIYPLFYNDCPGLVKTAPNLSDRASENDSVICSIHEKQND